MAKKTPTKPEASEQVLTEKLIGELRASGADLSKLTAQATPVPPPAQAPAPPPPPPSTETSALPTTPNAPVSGAPKKGFHFPHFSLPKIRKSPPQPELPKSEPQLVTSEVQQLTNEALMETIEKRLEKINNDDIVTLRLNKKELLAGAGLILAAIWLKPAVFSFNLQQLPLLIQKSPSLPSPSPISNPIPSPAPITIRLRMGSNSIESASEAKALLAPVNASVIDIMYDDTVNSQQALVVTKQEQQPLREQISSLLSKKYHIASEAATLTEDSAFTATVLIGKNANLKK